MFPKTKIFSDEFEEWYKSSNSSNRTHYSGLFGIHTTLRRVFFDKLLSWQINSEYAGMIVDLEYIVFALDYFESIGEITKQEIEKIEEELIKFNFGSTIVFR